MSTRPLTGMRETTVNGVRLAYQDLGHGEPLVLVHGSWTSHSTWDAVVPMLAPHHRVITYDRRGHSGSQRTAGQGTFADDVADLAGLVIALDAVPAWVVGNSVGAIIALGLAATRPDLLHGVVVHEPPVRGLLPAEADPPLRAVLDLIRAGDHAGAARRFAEDVAVGPGAWALLPEQLRATMTDNAATFLDEELAPDSRMLDEAALATYTGPVLISSGGASPSTFAPIAPHLATLLPQASLVTYADDGHVPHVTRPEAFAAQVLTFVARASRSVRSEDRR